MVFFRGNSCVKRHTRGASIKVIQASQITEKIKLYFYILYKREAIIIMGRINLEIKFRVIKLAFFLYTHTSNNTRQCNFALIIKFKHFYCKLFTLLSYSANTVYIIEMHIWQFALGDCFFYVERFFLCMKTVRDYLGQCWTCFEFQFYMNFPQSCYGFGLKIHKQ